jgi:hypothetical protein
VGTLLWVDVRVGVLLPAGRAIDRLSLSTGRVKVFMAVEYWYHVMVILKVALVSFAQSQASLNCNAHLFLPHTGRNKLTANYSPACLNSVCRFVEFTAQFPLLSETFCAAATMKILE